MARIRVGILGATGTVGQRFVQLLADHPQFAVTALGGSARSRGGPYAEACAGRLSGEMPAAARSLVVLEPEPPLDCDVVFSSLPADVAGPVETRLARAGDPVLSHSAAHRMDEQVAPLVPEGHPEPPPPLNAGPAGFIVPNPNSSTVLI